MAKKTKPRQDASERLGDLLQQSLRRLELGAQLEAYGVWPVWNEIVGKPVARNAQPEKIRHGTLFVKVSSPVWMQQLQFMKELIADKLNRRLRADIVKNIFFFVGPVDSSELDAKADAEPLQPAGDHNATIDDRFLDAVADPEIRQAFKKILRGYARRRQA
jgi:predicted nucleic acid-binding Zn ribbon protein